MRWFEHELIFKEFVEFVKVEGRVEKGEEVD